MTTDDVRAAAGELAALHARFAPLFGYQPAQQHAHTYLRGLLLHEGRKNVEAIALHEGGEDLVLPLQRFLTRSPWQAEDVQREIQACFAEDLVPSTAQWALGTVGGLDDSGFAKKGAHSCGVQRQWCGRLGKKENCQVGVFLVGITPAGHALLDHRLYLPQEWALDPQRRKQTGVPRSVVFRTKPEIGLDLLARMTTAGHVKLDWLVFDEGYGRDGDFLTELERRQQRYVGEVPVTTTVWTEDPATQMPQYTGRGRRPSRPSRASVRSVQEVARSLPAEAWQVLQLREGSGAPVVAAFAAVRVWAMRGQKPGPAVWLLVRKPLEEGGEWKYFVSNAGAETPLGVLALVSGCRVRVEETLQDGKTHLGMAQYEGRSWATWHHHMALVALAHLLVSKVRVRLKKKSGLTLDMAVRLLKAALPRPVLTIEEAVAIVDYHLRRNEIAKRSHAKTWKERHKGAKPKRPL